LSRQLFHLLVGSALACTTLAPGVQPARTSASTQHGPVSTPLIKQAGSSAAIVIADKATIAPELLSDTNLLALGKALNNLGGSSGEVVPLPVVVLGTSATPTLRAH